MRGRGLAGRLRASLAVCAVGAALALPAGSAPAVVHAQGPTPSPAGNPSITLTAQPLLGGTFRVGAWAAVRVDVANAGPAVDGELRLSSASGRGSTFSLPVQLATGARQEHFLYGNLGFFGNRYEIALVAEDYTHALTRVPVDGVASDAPIVMVVAERPEAIVGDIDEGLELLREASAKVVAIAPEDLPARVEPWASIDVVIWQDVESNRLNPAQLEAMQAWLATGGDAVIVNGSTGSSSLGAFEAAELLPYRPAGLVDVATADLLSLLGGLPPSAATTPVLVGELVKGIELARSGDRVTAARVAHGQGSVTLIGVDPSAPWLAGSTSAATLWSRALPPSSGALDPRPVGTDQSFISYALGNLPSVRLPRSDHLAVLVVGYIIAIGPLNYIVLRRRDRREWGWLTLPLTMIVFAVAILIFGLVLRGSSVVVSQLAIVHGATGSDCGIAEAHVAVYSPARSTFDIRLAGDALVTAQDSPDEPARLPLDVVLGSTTTARDYAVGFGAQRTFRAESSASVPLVETELRLEGDFLRGRITNASGGVLSDVVLLYSGVIERLGDLAAGESRQIEMSVDRRGASPLWERLYPYQVEADADRYRTVEARRTILQHLDGGWGDTRGSLSRLSRAPIVMAWASQPLLAMDLGSPIEHLGETLYLLPAAASLTGPVAFSGSLLQPSLVEADGIEAFAEGDVFSIWRGTIEVEYRPVQFDGVFEVDRFALRVVAAQSRALASDGPELLPLPADEQPDAQAPLATSPRPGEAPGMPRLQLYDLVGATWVEFEPLEDGVTYLVSEPARYVDESGSFRVRYVVRADEYTQFDFEARLEGNVR
jgi:hypothetical protein